MSAAERPCLQALAADVGILAEFVDSRGHTRRTEEPTYVALLAAMGIEAASEAGAAAALAQRTSQREGERIASARVVVAGTPGAGVLPLHIPRGASASQRWALHVRTSSGREFHAEGRLPPSTPEIPLPAIDELGFHSLTLRLEENGRADEAQQVLIVVPPRCFDPGARRDFGVCANLYSVRDGKRGFGDIGTLAALCRWSAREGAAFVGINPLNAIRASGTEISPYSPISRLFRSELYVDLEAVPEFGAAAADNLSFEGASDRLDYPAVRTHKRAALRRMHRVFAAAHAGANTERGRAYAAFVAAAGHELRAFAVFCALDEHLGTANGPGNGWRDWPAAYHDPQGSAVRSFARDHQEEIDFHCWVQFEIDRQLANVAADARYAGLALGLYQDLPIGASPTGCEEWLHRELFCRGAHVGAPPDAFFAGGQDWGLAPIAPTAPLAQRLRYWSRVLRAGFAHAGMLRVDHVMGLARQYWIPQGAAPRDGAYVRMPAEEMFGIVALESVRASAIAIGEDLGTVPQEIPRLMERWGVLSTKVLYFERTGDGSFRSPEDYPQACFVSANTHDLATLPGFESGRDLDLNEEMGILSEPEQRQRMRREREGAVQALRRETGAGAEQPLVEAAYGFLGRSRAALVGVALDDLGGETEPVNLPGVRVDRYPNWQRRMRLRLDEIAAESTTRATLAAVRRGRGEAR